MDYQITCVSDKLVFIRWFRDPEETKSENQFIHDLKAILDEVAHPVYILSDLREGRLKNVDVIRRLAVLVAHHPNFAGGTSFSHDLYTPLFVNLYSKFSHQDKTVKEMWSSLHDALNYLESLEPGVTQGIEWESLVYAPGLE
jgi:hypothetical protein